jgi:predicted secreted hydrolase
MVVLMTLGLNGCSRYEVPDATRGDDLFAADRQADNRDDLALWNKALSSRAFQFPQDHAAHEQFRIEWWYYTGNLVAEDGHRFGFQLTFFRTGTNYEPPNPSRWAVRDLYTAHFAVSDLRNRSHVSFQRNNRRGVGWAGAASERFEVWNGDWKAWMDGERQRLVAQQDDCAVDLVLKPTKPLVLHGDHGLSRKGATPGNASYYYSFTRLATTGTICVNGKEYKIEGSSWMDHEFSSSLLEAEQAGWDWFSIQFDNGQELMLYRMRRDDGTADEFSSGTLVAADGSTRQLTKDDFKLVPVDFWRSPHTQAEYPVRWCIEVPTLSMKLDVEASFADQEMVTQQTTGLAYWEGCIDVSGNIADAPVHGVGYLEMTGYSGRSLGELFRTD